MSKQERKGARPNRPVTLSPAHLVTLSSAGAACAGGLLLEPQRTWAGLLLVSYYLLTLGLGALVFLALLHVSGARWARGLVRVPEALAALLPVGAAGLLLVLLARPSLYPWTAHEAGEPAGWFRDLWLSRPFFLARAVLYLGLWLVFARAIVGAAPGRAGRWSAGFLVVFAVTCWLASYDWIMSLEPDWSSTIFGVYHFAGLLLAALAAVTVLAIWLRRRGELGADVTADTLHDLGKLLFGFSSFWMYTWFCQYLLIWYVNNPEETSHYVRRLHGAWGPLVLVNVLLNWGVPFLVLLPAAAKRNAGVLLKVALVVLVGRCLDLYLMIAPAVQVQPAFGLGEAGLLLGAGGLGLLVLLGALGRRSGPSAAGPATARYPAPAQAARRTRSRARQARNSP
jgi:hypothetical protein